MPESEPQRTYRRDAQALGELGLLLVRVKLPRVEVRPPRALAEQAVAAWERDDEGPLERETYEQRVQRHRAAALSLIGLEICERGRWDEQGVVVELNCGSVAQSVNASDDLPTP